jgi:hypothetical protein
MKKIIWIVSVLCIALSAHAQDDRYYDNSGTDDVYSNDNYDEQTQDDSGTSYQEFYDQLDPYGSWVTDPTYGNVWVPLQAGADFSPYETNGHWVYTDYGWTWVSDFEWGWATFHYGRWYQHPSYGWMWVPGYDWAPAWVVWGQYNGYYCWAPVGPGEYISNHYGGGDHHWYFVEQNHINDNHISNYIVSNTVVSHNGGNIQNNIKIISHVNSYNRSVFYAGPKANEVEKVTGHPVEKVSISNAAKPSATRISGNQVSIYRPAMSRSNHTTPAKVGRQQDLPVRNNSNNNNNSTPQRTTSQPDRNNIPQRDNSAPERQPSQQQWTPPRQSVPRQESQPIQQRPSGGGFVPREQPSYQAPRQQSAPVMHSSPAPAMHMGGGGGRH